LDLAARVALHPDEAVLVVGDLNVTDRSRAYRVLRGSLGDAYRDAGRGMGFTFPNGLRVGDLAPHGGWAGTLRIPARLLRLDYILHSRELVALRARVGCEGGSDHCFVLARLAWR